MNTESNLSAAALEQGPAGGRPAHLGWMLAFFVLSGLSGLIYQSVWTQYLSLLLGNSAYAQSLVLSIFMGGMALGAWLASLLVHRLRNLLMAYGLIEGLVGVLGVAFHAIFLAASWWLYEVWLPGQGAGNAGGLMRWLVAAALILPQTILLGMTFPVMSAGLMRWMPDRAGAVLGGLYFYNSIGAAGGALLATFVLIPAGGLPGAMGFAGALNILILAGVILARIPARAVAAGVAGSSNRTREETGSAARGRPVLSDRICVVMLAAAGLTGLSSFMYEVGWIRMLSLALGTSLHAFELMLASFIGGLALGGLYVRNRLDGVTDPVRYAARIQLLMGIAALATLPMYDHAFAVVGWLVTTLSPSAGGYVIYNIATAVISIVIMLPAAFFAGMSLPVMTFAMLRRGASESAIGQAYAINTLGAIVGVVLMVHFAMPLLGLKLGMVVAASIDLLLALILYAMAPSRPRLGGYALRTGAAVAAVVLVVNTASFDPRNLNSGVYRTSKARIDDGKTMLYAQDGKTASIAVFGEEDGVLTIATNGKPDASLNMRADAPPTSDEPTMILAALLGLAAHPNPVDVANIGFGSGLTTHTFTRSTRPERITTVEIEPRMVEAARLFRHRVEGAYSDPRSQIVIDDARAYFSGQGGAYDILVSEPSNPWVAGVGKLFSTEFYTFAKRHLKPGGLLVQWVQAYEISDATLLTILRALDAQFVDYALYKSNTVDIIILASADGPLPPMSEQVLREPGLAPMAEIAGVRTLADLAERRLVDRQTIRALIELDGGPANSDYHPVLTHWAPRDRFLRVDASMILGLHNFPLGLTRRLGMGTANHPDAWRSADVNLDMLEKRRQGEAFAAAVLGLAPPNDHADRIDELYWRGAGQRLRELGRDCMASADRETLNFVLADAYQATAPYLSDPELERLWVTREWLECAPDATTTAGRMLAVFRGIHLRDAAEVQRAATGILEGDEDGLTRQLRLMFAHALVYADALSESARGSEAVIADIHAELDLSALERFKLQLSAAIARSADTQLVQRPVLPVSTTAL